MHMNILAPVVALALSAGPVRAGAGVESLKAGADAAFGRAAATRTPSTFKQWKQRRPAPAAARGLDFTVEKRFDGEWAVTGPNADLTIRSRWRGSIDGAYEITGSFLGRRYDFDAPLVLRRGEFAGATRTVLEGPDLTVFVEQPTSWSETRVELSLGRGVEPSLAAALAGILKFLPAPAARAPFPSRPGTLPGGRKLSFSFRAFGGFLSVHGDEVDLSVSKREWGDRVTFDAAGTAFGRTFGFGEFVFETDPSFLGERGFRVRAGDLDVVARGDSFGGFERLEFRGPVGGSADFAFFVFTLASQAFGL